MNSKQSEWVKTYVPNYWQKYRSSEPVSVIGKPNADDITENNTRILRLYIGIFVYRVKEYIHL